MMPSFTEFQYFLEVANCLNLSRAAERLGLSQPSLSLAIKRLERALGTDILIRHQHGVALTPNGKQLVSHIRKLLNDWQDIRALTLACNVGIQGSYTLGCHSTIAFDVVVGFLPNLLANHPKLEIHLKNDVSRRILEQIINFKIDLGILVNPARHPDLIIRKLCKDAMTFWTLAQPAKVNDVYSGHAIALCDPDLKQTAHLLNKARAKGFIFDRVISMDSLEVIAHMTAQGCGVGILPTLMVNKLYPDKLSTIANAPAYGEDLCLVYRHEIRNIKAIQTITRAIKDYCDRL